MANYIIKWCPLHFLINIWEQMCNVVLLNRRPGASRKQPRRDEGELNFALDKALTTNRKTRPIELCEVH